jgi:hypothetical protein
VLASDRRPSTTYGAVDPTEDMAEAVAMVALGRSEWIPADRVGWVERWLGADATALAVRKPWAPAGSEEVISAQAVYDEEEVNRLSGRYSHVEPIYFQLPASVPDHESLATQIEAELGGRRLVGILQRTDDDRFPRYAGLFRGTGDAVFWVELWDFREATGLAAGPTVPILTYVVLW